MKINLIDKDAQGNIKVSFWLLSFLLSTLGLGFGMGFWVAHEFVSSLFALIEAVVQRLI